LNPRREATLNSDKYIGMDVQATTVVVVLDAEGKVVLETIVATEAAAILRLLQGLAGKLRVTFEETTQAAWLHGHEGTRTLKELVRAYETLSQDTERTMGCGLRRSTAVVEYGPQAEAFTRPQPTRAMVEAVNRTGASATRQLAVRRTGSIAAAA
jgi:hypothetical protein